MLTFTLTKAMIGAKAMIGETDGTIAHSIAGALYSSQPYTVSKKKQKQKQKQKPVLVKNALERTWWAPG